jgi:hypothetical protein
VLGGDLFEHAPLLLGQARALGELRAPLLEQVGQPLQPGDALVDRGRVGRAAHAREDYLPWLIISQGKILALVRAGAA